MALDIAADSALLVIDMRQGFADPFWDRRDHPLAEGNAARIVDAWRADLGYHVLFVIDAMHTVDVEGPDGSVVTAEELSRATPASVHGGGFARVVRTDDVLDAVA